MTFSRREENLFHAELSPEDVPILFLGERWSYYVGTAPRIKAPPFSLTELWAIVINYGHEREDIIFLACEALYKSLGLTVLAQETASYIE